MKIRIGYNTLRATKGTVYTWPNQARPASWFIGAIRKALSDDPSTPVRMEILSDEQNAVSDAFQKMAGCRMVTATHIDSLLRGEGVLRLAVFGPECEQDHHDLAQWTWPEVVKYLNENAGLVQHYEPDATKHRAAAAQRKSNRKHGTEATKAKAEANRNEIRRLFMLYKGEYPKFSKEGLQRTVHQTHPRKRGFSIRSIQAATKDL